MNFGFIAPRVDWAVKHQLSVLLSFIAVDMTPFWPSAVVDEAVSGWLSHWSWLTQPETVYLIVVTQMTFDGHWVRPDCHWLELNFSATATVPCPDIRPRSAILVSLTGAARSWRGGEGRWFGLSRPSLAGVSRFGFVVRPVSAGKDLRVRWYRFSSPFSSQNVVVCGHCPGCDFVHHFLLKHETGSHCCPS